MKADKRRLKLADFERGCVPLQNQLLRAGCKINFSDSDTQRWRKPAA
jgi:hypothetical protein